MCNVPILYHIGCPSACTTCATVSGGTCTLWCSQYGWCGETAAHKYTDCRGCSAKRRSESLRSDSQRAKISALIKAVHDNGGKFVWAIGGWSDLTKTIQESQIDAFVAECVKLLKLEGDGIDFDWEHLSDHSSIRAQQLDTLGKTLVALRKALDEEGLQDKQIGYTARLGTFWNSASIPSGYTTFTTDGEGIEIAKAVEGMGSKLNDVLDFANVMMYDVPPSYYGAPGGFTLDTYKNVFDAWANYVDPDKVVMGFEPGGQAASGVWEGMEVDKQVVDYIQEKGYAGIMFWAINQPVWPPSTEITGDNAQEIAEYAAGVFKA